VTEVLESNVDITARKQAEQQLRELNQELEDRVHRRTAELEAALADRLRSEQRFVTLANFVPQLVWMSSPEGLNVYFNQRWVDYTGMTLEESYGKGWNTPFHPDDRQVALDAWNRATRTGETYRIESRLRAAGGSYRWFLMLGEALRDAHGNIVQWFGTCTDIADMKQAEDALRESQRGLEEANKELQPFSYSVSHDLRGPLRTMDGFSQALLEDHSENLDEKGRHYLTRIRTAAQRMGLLIDDLLQLSRLTRIEMRARPVDLSAMAMELIGELRDSEPGRDVEVRVEPGLEALGDPGLLQVALQNLFSNAWKFTSRREHAVIEFGVLNDQPGPVFFVRDNGAGFDMQYANHLFSPFQRLHADEEFKGTGIGLATVQRIIRRHVGRIWAEAAQGQGATFYFQLGHRALEMAGEM
jgi:PAS domain S-box-containing protein